MSHPSHSRSRVSGRLVLAIIALSVPSIIFGFVHAATKADECAIIASASNASGSPVPGAIKCS